jgi:Regulator of chromosome condensation (RCC1) repeat
MTFDHGRAASLMLGATLALVASACGDASGPGTPGLLPPSTRALAAGASHTCAIESPGVYCWGQNASGELGLTGKGQSSVPVAQTAVGKDVVEVAANSMQTCVRRASGRVECWGWNAEGGLGDGTTTDRATPMPVLGVEDAIEIAAGGLSACVRRVGGTVSCWGAFGLGHGSLVAVDVADLADVVALRTSQPGGRYCARTLAGKVVCWQDGDTETTAPVEVPELAGTHDLAVAVDETCGLTDANQVLCVEDLGGLQMVDGVDDAVQISGGSDFVCWRRANGDVGCWDRDGVVLGVPRLDLSLDVPATDLSAGQVHFCVRVADGGVECFHDPLSGTSAPDALVRVADLPL